MTQFLIWWLTLTVIYALVLSSFAPLDIATGAVLSGALLLVFRRYQLGARQATALNVILRIPAFLRFLLAVFWQVLVGTWDISLIIANLRPFPAAGVVKIPIDSRTKHGVAISALAMTASPGTALIGIDWENSEMFVYVLNASNPDQVRKKYQDFYNHYQRKVFP
jgi:multisubunit Na+/H+ antiporter MnhE subunit